MDKKEVEKQQIKREADSVRLTLQMCQKAIAELSRLQRLSAGYFRSRTMRDIYRGLRMRRANTAATKVLVHSENAMSALNALETALRDGEAILNQQAKYYEQQQQATPRRVHPPIVQPVRTERSR